MCLQTGSNTKWECMETEIGVCEAKRDESPSVSPEKSNKMKEDESSVIGM